jgi:hypothetical protein
MSGENAHNMKEAMAAAARSRKLKAYEWCRLRNDFTDMPIWRAVAQKTGVHLASVLAIVMRLEALANRSIPRGSVADMSIPEFAAALDLRPAVVARVRSALEEPDIAWLDQDHVVDFHQRNPDHEDATAAERQRRRRAKLKSEREQALMRPPPSGFPKPVTRDAVTVTRDIVTVTTRSDQNLESGSASVLPSEPASNSVAPVEDARLLKEPRHIVTPRDIVTVTPEQSRAVTGNGAGPARGEAAGSPEEQAPPPEPTAEHWLATTGQDYVRARLDVAAKAADAKLSRWLRELRGDAAALVTVVQWAVASTAPGRPSHFEVVITDQIRRHREAEKGRPLPLGLVDQTRQGGGHGR